MAASNKDFHEFDIESNASDSDSDGYLTPTNYEEPKNKRTKKKKQQKFRKEWSSRDEFSLWLKPEITDSGKAKCALCNVSFVAQIQVIKNHMSSKKHLNKMKDIKSASSTVSALFKRKTEANACIKESSEAVAVKRAELKICAYMLEHKVAFLSADHLSELLKSCFPDSKIAQQIRLKRTKVACLSTNVIGASHKQELTELLQNPNFSVMIDDSTDISATKTTCVVVRFNDKLKHRIVSQYWQLVQVVNVNEPGKASADVIFNSVLNTFKAKNISLKNIIGFGSDGCATMMGVNNSVATRFKSECPGIYIFNCICHSLALCASEACKQLPRRCEDLSRNIYNFLKNSSKRLAEFKQFQELLDLKVHHILHPSQTRWLSLIAVVDRILEQWEALQFFFSNMWNREKLVAAEEIYKSLHDPSIKLYFSFLQWILPKFTGLNEYFQSSKVVLQHLHEKMLTTYKDLLMSFMDRDHVKSSDLNLLDINNNSKYIPLNQIYLGVNVMNELNSPKLRNRSDFKSIEVEFLNRCREFIKVGCQQIKKRYNFNDPVLSRIVMISPTAVLQGLSSIIPLAKELPQITRKEDYQKLDDQFRYLCIYNMPDDIINEKEIDVFWNKISLIEDGNGQKEFDIVAEFALGVLSLPHSNADCERVFSKVNLTKTKTRNKLTTSTLDGTLLSSQCIQESGNCIKFEPSDDMFSRFKSQMYAKTSYISGWSADV